MEIPQMLFLLVVRQLETWKQAAVLKWDLCLFPVQAAEGQPGPASPSSPPTTAQALRARGGAWLPGGQARAGRGNCAQEGLGVETLPSVLANATPGESHQLCDLHRVTAPSQAPASTPYLLGGKVTPFRVAGETTRGGAVQALDIQ